MAKPNRRVWFVVVPLVLGLVWWFAGRGDDARTDKAAPGAGVADQARTGRKLLDTNGAAPKATLPALAWQREVASISGTVTAVGGHAVSGASVCVWPTHPTAPSALTRDPTCTKTGNDGYYTIKGLPPVGLEVSAAARDHLPKKFKTEDKYPLRVRPGEKRVGVDFELEPGGVEVSGVVKDLAGGVVEGAFVTVNGGRWFRSTSARAVAVSDADGAFTAWVKEGTIRVSAQADGYGTSSRSGAAPGYFFELFLTPESVVSGRVVLAGTKNPVPNAVVNVSMSDWGRGAKAVTDADGRFRVDRLEPGSYHPKATADAGFGQAEVAVHVGLAQSASDVLIELHPAASLRGVVTLAGSDGAPCRAGSVNLTGTAGNSESKSGRTDANGSVTIQGLLPGSYDVSVNCRDHAKREDFDVLVVGTDPLPDQTWEVQEGLGMRGIVVDSEGDPIEGVSVWASPVLKGRGGSQTWGSDETSAEGTFELKGLLAGKFKVRASKDGYLDPTEEKKVDIADSDVDGVEITLLKGGTVQGRVAGMDGEPVSGVTVRVNGGSWRAQSSTNDEGKFTLEGAKPGEHRVIATKGWRKSLRAPGATDDDLRGELVTVVAGEVTEVELVVESQSGEISGKVVGPGGEPVSDAFVSCTRESDSAAVAAGGTSSRSRWGSWGERPLLTDDDGAFTVGALSDGEYTIRAYRKGGGDAVTEHIEVGSTGVTLEIETTGSLSGVVALAGGGAPARFSVSVRDEKLGIYESDKFYKTDGRWSLTELYAGEFEIAVTSDAGDAETTVTLAAGDDVDGITLELTPRLEISGRVLDLETDEPVAGISVNIGSRGGGFSIMSSGKADRENVTDDAGNFTLKNAAAGHVSMMLMPRDFSDDGYGWSSMSADVPADVTTYTMPDIHIAKSRKKRSDARGDTGFKTKDKPPGEESEDTPLVVAFVRPGGPAAKAGLAVGDIIEKVDGHDVTGAKRYLFSTLTAVKVGTSLEFGVGDRTLTVVATKEP